MAKNIQNCTPQGSNNRLLTPQSPIFANCTACTCFKCCYSVFKYLALPLPVRPAGGVEGCKRQSQPVNRPGGAGGGESSKRAPATVTAPRAGRRRLEREIGRPPRRRAPAGGPGDAASGAAGTVPRLRLRRAQRRATRHCACRYPAVCQNVRILMHKARPTLCAYGPRGQATVHTAPTVTDARGQRHPAFPHMYASPLACRILICGLRGPLTAVIGPCVYSFS